MKLYDAFFALARRGAFRWMGDRAFLRLQYRLKRRKPLRLDPPQTYGEKLQWLKLYDRQPVYTQMADKIAARNFVAARVGEKYLIPEIARYDRAQDVQWDRLPPRYALKCTHGSSCNIVQDGSLSGERFARQKARLVQWMKDDWFYLSREWPYQGVKPRILVEQFLEGPDGQVPYDYKFLCFDGEPKYIIVDVDRYKDGGDGHRRNFYDLNWVKQEVFNRHPGYDGPVERPQCLEEMIQVARKLSQGLRHIRIDLYQVGGRVYFGEMTFFHGCGLEVFRPRAFEAHLGELIALPGEAR